MPDLLNHGQISQLQLPEGWIEVEVKRHDFEQASLKEFEKNNGHLCFYFRGLPTNESAARAFEQVLSEASHHLVAREISDLSETLGDTADDTEFKILDARTEDWNNKRLLVIEGRWLKDKLDMIKFFIDARGDGAIVQEIYFFGPASTYAGLLPEIKTALRAIKWKVRENANASEKGKS
jgi:hypothetical protein